MQNYFYKLADFLIAEIQGSEILICNFEGEDSDFVRFNNNRVRQAGRVIQRRLNINLIAGRRHAQYNCDLSGVFQQDLAQANESIKYLRMQHAYLPEDPYLCFATNINNTKQIHSNILPDSGVVIDQIMTIAKGLDLVGILASGIIYTGFANSLGQRNWHSSATFNFDWSCYHEKDKAVKSAYAGFIWDPAILQYKMDIVRSQLEIIQRPSLTISPGKYRAYLAPTAIREIVDIMAWGGFSLKSHRTAQSPLIKMNHEQKCLHSEINIAEYKERGFSPIFTKEGFIKSPHIMLIKQGVYKEHLVSPRSAMEYSIQLNSGTEYPEALDMAAGDIHATETMTSLGTGLYINNLWYCNFSDRNFCRITGMTRFACFWVENGLIQAPINVMRFDESIYELFGNELIGLTNERDLMFDPHTYEQRSTRSYHLPGVLIKNFTLTL